MTYPGPPQGPKGKAKPHWGAALILIVAGFAVFGIASLLQAWAGSHMFEYEYTATGNALTDTIASVTWWPGWILSVLLVLGGIVTLFIGTEEPVEE
jgi:uncharacterized membrane protein